MRLFRWPSSSRASGGRPVCDEGLGQAAATPWEELPLTGPRPQPGGCGAARRAAWSPPWFLLQLRRPWLGGHHHLPLSLGGGGGEADHHAEGFTATQTRRDTTRSSPGCGAPLPRAPLTVAWRRKAARAEPAPELGGLRIRGLGMGRQAGCLWQWAWTRIRGSGSPRVPTCDITAGQASARGGSSAYGLRAAAGTSARDARARGPHGCELPRAAGALRVPRGTAGFHPSAGDRAAGSPAFLPCSLGAGWAARPCVTPSAIPILPALGVPAAPGGHAGARGAPPLASHGEGPGWPAPHR